MIMMMDYITLAGFILAVFGTGVAVGKLVETFGVRQCALQGLEIIQVEILSGKELTTPPEVSFELLLPEQKPTCGFIVMVRFHTLLRCRKDLFMLYKDFKSTGENLYHPHPCVRCGMSNNQKGRMAKVIQVVGQLHTTVECG